MRTDVEFRTGDGVILRGWHYRPANGSGPWPTIVMAHGFSAVKEMDLARFAEGFAAVTHALRLERGTRACSVARALHRSRRAAARLGVLRAGLTQPRSTRRPGRSGTTAAA